jgi:S1-C subfamily serine protease
MNVTLTLRHATAVVLLASAVMNAGCASAPTRAKSREEILGKILPSAVQVVVEQHEGRRIRSGSGVALASRRTAEGPSCFVLTSGHTVSGLVGKTEIYAVFSRHLGPGRKARALVVAQRNDVIDLALLRAESEECAPVALASAPVLGEAIWVIGFPLGRHIMLSSGVVSQVALDDASDPVAIAARLIVDAPVNYGVSGGGVFDARTGALIGVVEGFSTARLTAHGATPSWYIDVPVPGQTLVTPLTDIKRFLRESEQTHLLPP